MGESLKCLYRLLQLLNAEDISGLRVTSSERIAVVVAVDSVSDVVMTQLPPVHHWHTQYLHLTTRTCPSLAHSVSAPDHTYISCTQLPCPRYKRHLYMSRGA